MRMNMNKAEEDDILKPDTWVDRYGDYLFRFALARVKDPGVAEDLVQETFLAALRGLQNFKRRSSGHTWLTAILKHKIVDYFRKKHRELVIEDIETVSETTDGFFKNSGNWKIRPGKWDVNPAKIFEQKEFMNVLLKCLAQLPERLAQAFMLREMEGLSTEELCKSMQISATNSWVMLYRARTYLRRCLEITWFNKPTGETE
jgi:RNA polymerase sigma-70 factor (ECF subfamily)